MSNLNTLQLVFGLILGPIIAGIAWKIGALTISGAVAAAATGALIFGLGGIAWATLLLGFFISSSFLSQIFSGRKSSLVAMFAKSSRRDWAQVLSNSGLGTLLVIAQIILPGAVWLWIGFSGAMAAVNADTWSTELGVLSKTPPRLITSGKPVEKGTSGGVSLLGITASIAGAAFIGALAIFFPHSQRSLGVFWWIVLAGISGSLFDSFLGATVQVIFFCPNCARETEHYPHHTCGTATRYYRGWQWLNNDAVNAAASLVGALVAAGGWLLFTD